MNSRLFVDEDGFFIGVFGDGALPDIETYFEVFEAPPVKNSQWDGDQWVAPKEKPTDYSLQPYQFHAMLDIGGVSGAVDRAIEAITDPAKKAVVKARMKHSTKFDRDDSLFSVLGPSVGLTDEQIDALWMQAKDL